MDREQLRIGSGAGFAGDRWEPAVELVEHGDIDVLAFECLAERTIARETLALRRGDGPGYSPKLEARFRAVLPGCAANGIRVVTNMGAAAPLAAARAACAARPPRRPAPASIARVRGARSFQIGHEPQCKLEL